MDINTLGVGAIIGATLVSATNLYVFLHNRKKDELEERIQNLYTPLYAYYLEHLQFGKNNNYALGLYNDFLELKKIYISNSIYASDILKELFEEILSKEADYMRQADEEIAHQLYYKSKFIDDKGIEVTFKDMMYRLGGWIKREHDELQLYYVKGIVERILWRLENYSTLHPKRKSIPAGRSFDY